MSAREVGAAVVAAALVAWVLWRRRRISRERLALALLAAAGLAVYASGVLSDLPDPKEVIGDVAGALGPWTYALVGALAFLETGAFVGLVAPGETVVIAGGVIAGQGEIDLVPLIGLVWLCAILGDTTSFFVGRRLGRGFLERHGPKVKITSERLRQVEGYFQRHGGKTILVGRFIGLVRALAPFVAGSSRVPYRRFLPFSVVGTGLWSAGFTLLGYVFWQSFDQVAHVAGQAVLGFGITVGAIVGVVAAYRRLRKPEERERARRWLERQERKRALRPLFRVARPIVRRALVPAARGVAGPIRFAWERFTPGELGLELTTALSVGAVGLYVFVLYTVMLAGDPGLTPLDREMLDASGELRAGAAVDVARVVTDLGALPTTAALVAGTALLLALRGRPLELVTLVAAFALVYAGVHIAKAGVDRPRPEDSLVDTRGAAFPSGHAAYATAWVAAAVLVARRLGAVRSAALVLAGIGVAGVVGLTRIYLGAHYWSDVAGGWGLGLGIFGTLGAVALLVAHIRQNALEPPRR